MLTWTPKKEEDSSIILEEVSGPCNVVSRREIALEVVECKCQNGGECTWDEDEEGEHHCVCQEGFLG